MAIKSISFRIDSEILDKLHYIASSEDRSANGQVVKMLKEMIEKYEAENGEITFNRDKTDFKRKAK